MWVRTQVTPARASGFAHEINLPQWQLVYDHGTSTIVLGLKWFLRPFNPLLKSIRMGLASLLLDMASEWTKVALWFTSSLCDVVGSFPCIII